jgi:SH3 domain protein
MTTLPRSAMILAAVYFTAFVLPHPALAQQMYVDDRLVLNVYAEANQGGERIATIETGDEVELIERVENSARIRLADGREGWVGASYLTSNAPAAIRLKQLQEGAPSAEAQAEQKKLNDEVARLRKQNAELQKQVEEARRIAAAARPPARAPVALQVAVEPEPEPEPQSISHVQPQDPLRWIWAGAVLAALGLGFLLGYQALARRIRRKYGRVNII